MTHCSSDDYRTAILKLPQGLKGISQVECTFQEMRGRRLSLETPFEVPRSAAVSVEYEDALYLGEVIRTTARGGRCFVEIDVEQILSGLSSLMALRNRLLADQPVRPAVGIPVRS
jgi:hypothetical protein